MQIIFLDTFLSVDSICSIRDFKLLQIIKMVDYMSQ